MDLREANRAYESGRLNEAEVLCRRALAAEPEHVAALHRLGMVLCRSGRAGDAVPVFQRLVELRPDVPGFRCNLAGALGSAGDEPAAIGHLLRAAEIDPGIAEVHHNLGVAFEHLGRLQEAALAHRRALTLRADYAEAHNHLGNVLRKLGRVAEAAECHGRALALRPDYAKAYNSLGAALAEQGDQPRAVACHRRAVELDGRNPTAHSALLYTMHYDAGATGNTLLLEARRWAERHGRRGAIPAHDNVPEPERRLRVGYVSPDFHEHPVPRLIGPALRQHDRSQFQVFCYSSGTHRDRVTERVRGTADVWREVSNLGDDAVAALIRSDGIDILVDLAGHWAGNRMTLFASKPSPVQTQILYPGTTGLNAVDWRITDPWSDPPAETDGHYAERLVRLPRCAWCYEPDENSPPVVPPPALAAGFVTFGCLNNPVKVTDQCLRLWGRVLENVRGSRLLLLSAEGREDRMLLARLDRLGIDPARISPVRRQSRDRYLELFNHIDIALDPFPYNGETTTCDGLWMGVPHVALAGERCSARRGVSHLCNLGLNQLVGASEEAYVHTAAVLAADLPKLAELRQGLRERMARSPLMDYARYTANLEAAYRQMWRDWCAGRLTCVRA